MHTVLILAFVVFGAALVTGLLGWRHARTGRSGTAWVLTLLVLLPALWLVVVWIEPAGVSLGRIALVAPILTGVLVCFHLVAAAPRRQRRLPAGAEPRAAVDGVRTANPSAPAVDTLLWLLLVSSVGVLVVALVA